MIHLLLNGIDFSYEPFSIEYKLNNAKHNYIPDFLVGNTIIKTKGEPDKEKKKIKATQKACEKEGFCFKLVTHADILKLKKELKNLGFDIKSIIDKSREGVKKGKLFSIDFINDPEYSKFLGINKK